MSEPQRASRRANDRRLLLRALLTTASVRCEADAAPAMTRSSLFEAAPAFRTTIQRPNRPDDDRVQLQVRAPGIRNPIYLTLNATMDGINLTRLRGLVHADLQMRVLTATATVMVLIGLGFVAAAVHTLTSGPGDVDVAIFHLFWASIVIVGWLLWMHGLVMAAASLRRLLEQAFTTVTFSRRDRDLGQR